MDGSTFPAQAQTPASAKTGEREWAVYIELLPPVLRSPTGGGPLVERARCEVGGITYEAESKSGAICEICRGLMAAGVPDGPWRAYRDGKLALIGRSVHRMAGMAVSEGGKSGPKWVKWRPFPDRFGGDE
ncbi:hypothetical protein [Acidocella aminolytica]|uniref:Uncharacterized protein n=1 Tax=Acidocella aminolytica 101 = DSM 11237 TaxID=1120923 RepID=A0A0D6PDS8_9PROT|nr:hypothetical protein [Acidocella aminolytica]GAN79019.1 hypothetical protein Aam_015_029 [Acidocella aminolytica 101 = DSM 11237]GBQ38437.1 hypothetical protein AA11237_1797 [Acidocella aminolytica 101 = DSM 11237]SHF37800.1 hypothetical protein SAMN02746095_03037 [Acidocella aminolytica 101 = DSM 11237]